MPENLDPLFPELPEDLSVLEDDALTALLDEHIEAARAIETSDEEFLKGLSGDEIIAQFKTGADQIKTLRAEQKAREDAHENYKAKIGEISAELEPAEEVSEEAAEVSEPVEVVAEVEPEVEEVVEEERELVTASAEETPKVRYSRTPPAPSAERQIRVVEPDVLSFVASGGAALPPGEKLDSDGLVRAVEQMLRSLGPVAHYQGGREEKFRVASLDYGKNFPAERTLARMDGPGNAAKIADIGNPFLGKAGLEALLASGGLCAPLEPLYSLPTLGTDATPVEDALPFMRAERGGINVPTPGTIDDILVDQEGAAITQIDEADDALGGTYATKTCQDVDCPEYTEVAVRIIAACREFGNLLSMSWPEFIRHQIELTRMQHARTSENFLLERIKALSINVTDGVDTAGALPYLVDAIKRSMWGIRGRHRLAMGQRYVALMPAQVQDLLAVDTAFANDSTRFTGQDALQAYVRQLGVDVVYYLDGQFAAGNDAIPAADQANGNPLDDFPDTFQWAMFPAGTFLGIDMAELNLGVVRDSTLNSTNDFQVFWERFLNVARIGPQQAAHWHTTDICPNGMLAPAGTARTCS